MIVVCSGDGSGAGEESCVVEGVVTGGSEGVEGDSMIVGGVMGVCSWCAVSLEVAGGGAGDIFWCILAISSLSHRLSLCCSVQWQWILSLRTGFTPCSCKYLTPILMDSFFACPFIVLQY